MENLTLTKAEQNLIERVNQRGGVAMYKSWVCNNVADKRNRYTQRTNLENLLKKLKANNALHLVQP